MELTNKKCIITGSAQGLGKAFAKILLDLGAQVCISDVNVDVGNIALTEFKKAYGEKNVCFVLLNVMSSLLSSCLMSPQVNGMDQEWTWPGV